MSIRRDPDQMIAAWLRGDAQAGAPDRLLSATRNQLEATNQRRPVWPAWRFRDMNTALRLVIATAAVVVVAVVAIGNNVIQGTAGIGRSPVVVTPTASVSPTPLPTAAVTPSPTPTVASSPAPPDPTPSTAQSQVDHGWPGSRGNPPGRYSFDEDTRAKQEQTRTLTWGFMHNLGSHLEVLMSTPAGAPSRGYPGGYGHYEPGPTATTVGGYNATYQEQLVNVGSEPEYVNAAAIVKTAIDKDVLKRQVWIVDINGTPVTIELWSRHDATSAELAEATAFIDSIRVERTTSRTGFKLTFDLLGGWDSG